MLRECPHCHSNTGFVFSKIVRHEERILFTGECLSVEGETLRENKNIICIDCKKKIANIKDLKIENDCYFIEI